MKLLMAALPCALVLFLETSEPAYGQAPVISSFSQNGVLLCTNLAAGSVATVEWASSPDGPWKTNWAGLDAVTVNSNGVIQVNVPMFYRVRGVSPTAPVNQRPIAVDDTESMTADTMLVRDTSVFLANDIDPDGPALTVVSVFSALNGTVTLSGTSVVFAPAAGFRGVASFAYTVSDGTLTDIGTVVVFVF